jgi:hypothetical protein
VYPWKRKGGQKSLAARFLSAGQRQEIEKHVVLSPALRCLSNFLNTTITTFVTLYSNTPIHKAKHFQIQYQQQ